MPKFTIQQHDAEKAGPHWDLRLEKGNVAESFAIPKAKMPDTGEKIFAAGVPAHKISYMNWEGTIPKGQYGAGKVSVYDKGTYTTDNWDDEKIDITFNGKKVKGNYVLVNTDADKWLIVKPVQDIQRSAILSQQIIDAYLAGKITEDELIELNKENEDKPNLPPTYDITQCSYCERYIDKNTKEFVEKPTDFEVVSHGMCPDCYEILVKDFKTASLLLEAISGNCDICHKHSDHLQKHRKKPGYEGGEYVKDNIQLLCSKCHKELHQESGSYEMGGEWKHENLRKELGEEGYSKWQAKRGKEKQKKVKKELGEEGYSERQREIALQRWHPKKKQKKSALELPETEEDFWAELEGNRLEIPETEEEFWQIYHSM